METKCLELIQEFIDNKRLSCYEEEIFVLDELQQLINDLDEDMRER